MSIFWIIVAGQFYGMDSREKDHRGRSRPRGVSVSIPEGVYEELRELALAAREASRQWRENNPDKFVSGLRAFIERREGADGTCTAPTDGVDVSVNIWTGGAVLPNECIGGQWAEFRRRFFALVDGALEPLASQ